MSYSVSTAGNAIARETPAIQAAARENLAEAAQINDRLVRLLERLRAPRPQAVPQGAGIEPNNPNPTLEAVLSLLASQHRRTHEMLTDVESLI